MTNTFDTSSFTQKTISDIGGIAAGKPGVINLIPSMPGMGIVSSIRAQCNALEGQAPIQTRLVQFDEIQPIALGVGPRSSPGVDLTGVQVVVVDAGGASMTASQIKELADFVSDARANASVWVVGGDTDGLEKQLEGDVSRFGNTFRSRFEGRSVASTPSAKAKP